MQKPSSKFGKVKYLANALSVNYAGNDIITEGDNYFLIAISFQNSNNQATVGMTWWLNYNRGQNIWHKVKKSSEIGQDFKKLLSNFACFLPAIVKV